MKQRLRLAARLFLNKGVQNVLITLGSQGAYFQNENLSLMIDAPVVQAMDTTAAGDTFSGALAVAITENMDWKKAIQFAVEAASISVTRLGAQSSVPYRSEITNLIKQKKQQYVHCRKLRTCHYALCYHHVLLGIVGQHNKTYHQNLAI